MAAASTRVPKWRQVLDDLEQRITAGEFSDRFPTDRELVERYEVSRATVREAVGRLTARGVIERQRGRGSVVTSTQFLQPMGTLYSLFQAVEATGVEQVSEVLSIGWATDARAAQRLGLPADEELFQLERVRYAGGEPLALDNVWLPRDIGEPLLGADLTRAGLYDVLEELTGVVPDRGEEVVAPVVPDEALRTTLAMDDDEAAMRVERVSFVGDRHVECRLTLVRGSRFALVSRWPDGAPATPRIDPDRDPT